MSACLGAQRHAGLELQLQSAWSAARKAGTQGGPHHFVLRLAAEEHDLAGVHVHAHRKPQTVTTALFG